MEINEAVLDGRERIGFRLRELYHRHGHSSLSMYLICDHKGPQSIAQLNLQTQ